MSQSSTAVVLACLLGIAPAAQAAPEEIVIEHGKINTADASPVDPGHFELEPSFAYTRSERAWSASGHAHGRGLFREQNVGLSFTAGLVDNVDLNISGGYSWLKDNDNDFDGDGALAGPVRGEDFTDLEVGGRYRFYHDEALHLEIAYIAGMTIPTGSCSGQDEIGTGQEFWSLNQTLVATKDWGRWTLNGDIGFALPFGSKRENARGTFNADLALGYQVLPWLQPEVELNYGHDYLTGENDAQIMAVTAGLVMPIDDTLRVNIGVQQGVWGESADKATTLISAVKFAF
ncbi:transporter [Desulfobulbus sp.]|uniref:transporter n=1 Tax=Desulfobulbus sp. TaxID=895 RepID=UPI00286F199A|nr:transporter [Desulfobulbus sp.]